MRFWSLGIEAEVVIETGGMEGVEDAERWSGCFVYQLQDQRWDLSSFGMYAAWDNVNDGRIISIIISYIPKDMEFRFHIR